MQMTGNTILITGGGSGIGRGLAEAFHHAGNQVIIAGRRKGLLDEVTAANPGMRSIVLDVEGDGSIEAFAEQAVKDFPTLNVLINNAGIMKPELLKKDESPRRDGLTVAESTIRTNLLGPIRLTAALLPQLKSQPHAAVMMVTSGLAFVPMAATPTYCATKAAIHSYTQSLRYQLKDTRVEVFELIPPYVATELMGSHQASDPRAMPLDDFVTEVMEILRTQPNAVEICVERVKPLRYAAESGHYGEIFKKFNDETFAALAGQQPEQ